MNALDGFDLADAFLSRKAMRRVVLVLAVVVCLLIAVGALSIDQVGMFVYDQSLRRAEDLLEPAIASLVPAPVPTTTITPYGG